MANDDDRPESGELQADQFVVLGPTVRLVLSAGVPQIVPADGSAAGTTGMGSAGSDWSSGTVPSAGVCPESRCSAADAAAAAEWRMAAASAGTALEPASAGVPQAQQVLQQADLFLPVQSSYEPAAGSTAAGSTAGVRRNHLGQLVLQQVP